MINFRDSSQLQLSFDISKKIIIPKIILKLYKYKNIKIIIMNNPHNLEISPQIMIKS